MRAAWGTGSPRLLGPLDSTTEVSRRPVQPFSDGWGATNRKPRGLSTASGHEVTSCYQGNHSTGLCGLRGGLQTPSMFLLGSPLPDECFRKEGPRESIPQSQKAEVWLQLRPWLNWSTGSRLTPPTAFASRPTHRGPEGSRSDRLVNVRPPAHY